MIHTILYANIFKLLTASPMPVSLDMYMFGDRHNQPERLNVDMRHFQKTGEDSETQAVFPVGRRVPYVSKKVTRLLLVRKEVV